MRNINKGRLFMLSFSFVSAIAMTVGLWWNGTDDPFVAGTLVALTVAAWAPFAFVMSEAFHYVEGWHYDCGFYHKDIRHHGRTIHALVYRQRNLAPWKVVLRETIGDDYNGEVVEVDFWSEGYLHDALSGAYHRAISVIINDEQLNSPF